MTDLEEVPTPDAPEPGAVFDALPEDVQVAAGTFAIVLSKVAMNMATKVEADFAGDHLAALYLAQVKRADEAEAKLAARAAVREVPKYVRNAIDAMCERSVDVAEIAHFGRKHTFSQRAAKEEADDALDAAILRFAREGK